MVPITIEGSLRIANKGAADLMCCPFMYILKIEVFAMHKIPFDTGEEEKLLGPLSMSATLWIGLGFFMAFRLAKAIPALPLPHLFAYFHYAVPVLMGAAMAFVKYKDMTLMQYVQMWVRYRLRKKTLLFERKNYIKEQQ